MLRLKGKADAVAAKQQIERLAKRLDQVEVGERTIIAEGVLAQSYLPIELQRATIDEKMKVRTRFPSGRLCQTYRKRTGLTSDQRAFFAIVLKTGIARTQPSR